MVDSTAPRDFQDLLPHKKISHLCSSIDTMQKQIKGLIAHALDMDGEKRSVSEKMVAYYNAEDGDPLDVLVLCSECIRPLSLVECYPIGVISMEDSGSLDEKIIAIPFQDPTYNTYQDISELPNHVASEIRHFFRVYKSLEGKETVVSDVLGREEAIKIIIKCQNAYIEKYCR